jgi:hypothetical protein
LFEFFCHHILEAESGIANSASANPSREEEEEEEEERSR